MKDIEEGHTLGFQVGHEKRGGRQVGTLNKVGREARELARGLLGDPEYLSNLKTRLARGQAPRVELHLWELAYGRPRVELDNAPEEADPTADLAQLLEKLGEDPNTHPAPPGADGYDGKEDPGPPTSTSSETKDGAN